MIAPTFNRRQFHARFGYGVSGQVFTSAGPGADAAWGTLTLTAADVGAGSIDWTLVETLWGVPAGGTSVGPTAAGATVFTFVDGTTGSLDGSFQTSAGRDLTETVG